MIDLQAAWDFISQYEGCESAFYQDVYGKMTYGCGNHALLSKAILLDWMIDGRAATDKEVERDYVSVRDAPPGKIASWYRGYSKCRLSDSSIRRLFNDRISEFDLSLAGVFPGFHSMPNEAQLALIDMVFNLGVGTLLQGFPTFVKAIKLGAYDIAAQSCHRKNPDSSIEKWDIGNLHERRQCDVRDMLLSCVPR